MGQKCCRPEMDELEDVGKNKPIKQKNSYPGALENSLSSSVMNDSTANGEGDNDDDEGAIENLMNPGKKISLNDFIRLKVIGRGSFGKVYLVRKRDTGIAYAMKILKKDQLIKKNLLIKTQAERDILEKVKNPYIVGLHYAFQTETKLYFVIDFLNGGELFTYLRKDKQFSEQRAKIYAAEIVDALGCLHEKGIIYRDLKPENVLLDSDGHIRITDFGLSKQNMGMNDKTHSFCGTPEYLAPEIIKGSGHGRAADWWSLGALLYEMLCGRPPHYNRDRQQMLRDIVEKQIPMKPFFSNEAIDFLKALLQREPSKRIGTGDEDAAELKKHPFFAGIDWDQIRTKTHETVYRPKVKGVEDTSCIDKLFTREALDETPVDPGLLNAKQKEQAHFDGFTYAPNKKL